MYKKSSFYSCFSCYCFFLCLLNQNQKIFNNSNGINRINKSQILVILARSETDKQIDKITDNIKKVTQTKDFLELPHNILNTNNTIKDTGSANINVSHK